MKLLTFLAIAASVVTVAIIIDPMAFLIYLGIAVAVGIGIAGWIVTWDHRNRKYDWPGKTPRRDQ